jgi:phospholipid/cholesterol/gamma-HCH transport system substrate-binding protein
VDSVTPEGQSVRVVLTVDHGVKVPAGAQAAVLSPSLVSDRYVQLLPAWTAGATIADGADIPLTRTAVPVELDQVTQSLDDVSVALGPQGANADGSLSRLLATSSANLGGQGQAVHDTVNQLSLAVGTLSGSRQDLFGTVKNLQAFTSTLAADDPQVRRLNSNLAQVADQLDGEKGDLGLALKNLAVALSEISTFVADNRTVLRSDVGALTSITGTIAADRAQLAETLDNAPVALSNLQNAYDPGSGTLDVRDNADQLKHPADLVCGLVSDQLSTPTGCNSLLAPLLDPLTRGVPGSSGGAPSLPLGLLSATPGSLTVDRVGPDRTLGGIAAGTR